MYIICDMKNLLSLIVLVLVGYTQVNAQTIQSLSWEETPEVASVAAPSLHFPVDHITLGQIERGDMKEMKFHFINNGNEDIKIEIVSGCECTTLDWPRLPIKPGAKGYITALFDSTEKEHSETVEIDINLENNDPKTGYPMFVRVQYDFEFAEN